MKVSNCKPLSFCISGSRLEINYTFFWLLGTGESREDCIILCYLQSTVTETVAGAQRLQLCAAAVITSCVCECVRTCVNNSN